MMTDLDINLIVPLIKPKYENAMHGCFAVKDGKMFFVSDNNIIFIREHFPAAGASPETLVENTIRYDSENLSENAVENQDNVCYNIKVNDVL